jgi:hypothetical protein
MVSPYVPLLHIKNWILGIKGHVCSFPHITEARCLGSYMCSWLSFF